VPLLLLLLLLRMAAWQCISPKGGYQQQLKQPACTDNRAATATRGEQLDLALRISLCWCRRYAAGRMHTRHRATKVVNASHQEVQSTYTAHHTCPIADQYAVLPDTQSCSIWRAAQKPTA
jgi:hypothetical protein